MSRVYWKIWTSGVCRIFTKRVVTVSPGAPCCRGVNPCERKLLSEKTSVHSYQALQHGRVWFFLPVRAEPCWQSPSGAGERDRKPLCCTSPARHARQHQPPQAACSQPSGVTEVQGSKITAKCSVFAAGWLFAGVSFQQPEMLQPSCCSRGPSAALLTLQILSWKRRSKKCQDKFELQSSTGHIVIVLGIISCALTIQFLLRTEILLRKCSVRGEGKKALQSSSVYNHWRKHSEVTDQWGRVSLSSSVGRTEGDLCSSAP